MSTRRALHFVFKIGNRTESARFYRALGMKFLRHEEFEEGCQASCNGPYDGKWSKSMVGYGPEDDHFVMELTYNYGIGSYKLGNDFVGITVNSKNALENVKKAGFPVESNNNVLSPDGYKFTVLEGSSDSGVVSKVTLACSNIKKSTDFWTRLCGMENRDGGDNSVEMSYADGQCRLELVQTDQPIDRATAFGRFAISCPSSELKSISDLMTAEGQTILTPLISLDTPGKATVQVIIVADPDGHEICFVGDEAFRELSQVDPKADALLDEAMAADKSDEWFAKKGKSKASG